MICTITMTIDLLLTLHELKLSSKTISVVFDN